jgi:hypothetical protein
MRCEFSLSEVKWCKKGWVKMGESFLSNSSSSDLKKGWKARRVLDTLNDSLKRHLLPFFESISNLKFALR